MIIFALGNFFSVGSEADPTRSNPVYRTDFAQRSDGFVSESMGKAMRRVDP